MPQVFISYRRDDSAASAGRIFDRLTDRFGKDCVFRDLDTIEPGAKFGEVIAGRIAKCDALVAVIGRDWLNAADAGGRRRLANPKDFVRAEIREALRLDKPVIPALVEGAAMPKKSKLPRDIAGLAGRNAIDISESRFDYDVERLIRAIAPAAVAMTRRLESQVTRSAEAGLGGSPLRTLLVTVFASIAVLVFSELALGWRFDAAEISLIVLVVLAITVAASRFMARRKRHGRHV